MSNLSVNAIRFLGVDAINQSNSGHPGVVMGAAPMGYTLFTRQMHVNPEVPNWSWFNASLCAPPFVRI